MTDVIIIHSKYGNATNHWYEWLKHKKVKSQVDHFTDLHLKMINMFLIKRLKG